MAKSASTIVICDAGPLIHLDELGSLELLNEYDRVLAPEVVWQEVHRHRPQALNHPAVPIHQTALTKPPSNPLIDLMQSFHLDPGETAALTLMEQEADAVLLSDDLAARLVAERMKFEYYGTIGVLLQAVMHQRMTSRQVRSLLRSIPVRTTLHVKKSFLQEVIDQLR